MADNPVTESVEDKAGFAANDSFSFGPENDTSFLDEIMYGPEGERGSASAEGAGDDPIVNLDDLIGTDDAPAAEAEPSKEEGADEDMAVKDNAPEPEPDPLKHQTKKALDASARYHQSRADKAEAELQRLRQRLEDQMFSGSAAGTQKGNPDQVSESQRESALPAQPVKPKKPNTDDPFEQAEYLEQLIEYQEQMTEYRLAEQQQRISPDLQAVKAFQQQIEQERKVNEAVATVTRMGMAQGLDSAEAEAFARSVVSGELQNNEAAWIAAYRAVSGKQAPASADKPAAPARKPAAPDTRERVTSASAAKGDSPVSAPSFQERMLQAAEAQRKPDLF